MRLRQSDKDEIARRFVAAQTAEKAEDLKRKVGEAGRAIYDELVQEKYRPLVAKLPASFFHSGSEISAKLHGQRWSQRILLGETRRIPESLHYAGEEVSEKASVRYQEAEKARSDYEEKIKALRLACDRTLRNISTLKRLEEVWPEGAVFAPEAAKADRSVPVVVTCDAINAALALV